MYKKEIHNKFNCQYDNSTIYNFFKKIKPYKLYENILSFRERVNPSYFLETIQIPSLILSSGSIAAQF